MALAIQSTCCCKSLCQACIILLYFNLVLYGLEFLGVFMQENNPFSFKNNENIRIISTTADALLMLIGFVVVFVTIATINQGKKSRYCLIIVIWFLLMHSTFIVIMMILVSADAISEIICDKDKIFRGSSEILWINVIYFIYLVFELCSALACYNYKEELKQISLAQINILGTSNESYNIAVLYRTQPHRYGTPPPEYPAQPAQNLDIPPPPYCTPPVQDLDIPPPYSSLSVQDRGIFSA